MKQQDSGRTAGNVFYFIFISECMMFSLSWSEEIFHGNTAIGCERQLGLVLTTSCEELPSIRSTLSSISCSTRQDSMRFNPVVCSGTLCSFSSSTKQQCLPLATPAWVESMLANKLVRQAPSLRESCKHCECIIPNKFCWLHQV